MSRDAKALDMPVERLLWTAGIVLGSSVPHWATLTAWVPTLLCACVAWRLACTFLSWPKPNSLVRLLLALAAFAAVLFEYHTINGVDAGSALLVVMVALKFLESQTDRDQLVLMIIAYFVVFAGLLYERSLFMVVYLLAFVLVTTIGLLQLGRRGPMLSLRATLGLASRLLLQSLPIMIILFLLFPRLPGPLWGMPGNISAGQSGLDEEMTPGDLTELGLSDEVAFRVEFTGRAPRADQLYWRGPVLSNFNGRTWSRDPGMRRRAIDTLEYFDEPVEYRVMLEPHGKRWTFALDMPQHWEGERSIFMSSDYQLLMRFSDAARARIDYRVTSYPQYLALENLTDADKNQYLRLPPRGNPRTRALIDGWLESHPQPQQLIQRALSLFREERFFYTLTPPALGANTADEFLFDTREGFCEHYASAFTIMMRMAGIPARVVTGYQGGELNPLGEYYIIRQSDAHAWTEVWLAGEGWVRVDPTAAVAPDRIALGSAELALGRNSARRGLLGEFPLLRRAALAWDAVNTYWQTWVLDYGPQMQQRLLESLGIRASDWTKMIALAATLTLLMLAALTVYLSRLYRSNLGNDPAARSFRRFCIKTRRATPPRRPGEGAVAFGQRAARAMPELAVEIEQIVNDYLRARYEPDPDGLALARLQDEVRLFRARRARA